LIPNLRRRKTLDRAQVPAVDSGNKRSEWNESHNNASLLGTPRQDVTTEQRDKQRLHQKFAYLTFIVSPADESIGRRAVKYQISPVGSVVRRHFNECLLDRNWYLIYIRVMDAASHTYGALIAATAAVFMPAVRCRC
jgi:hypothetical protein